MIHMLLSFILAVGMMTEHPQSGSKPDSGSPQAAADVQPTATAVKPDDSVITVFGTCRDNSAKTGSSADCKTIVTREKFERLIAALAIAGQPVPANGRQQLAQTYADLLAYEEAARPSGVESSREFQELMELVRLRTLSEIHRRKLQAKYREPSSQDIDDYYHQNPLNFTDIKLHRLLIPRRNPTVENQEEYEKHALQVASELRDRAVNGEEFTQLQREGYAALGLTSPPATDMGNRRKANLLAESRDEILSLNAGGVSKVEKEPYSFVIYKVGKRNLLPEEAVKEEISRELSRQRLENALKEITGSVHPEFNQQYFTAEPQPPANTAASSAGVQQPSRTPQ
jgi:hypothetical protein